MKALRIAAAVELTTLAVLLVNLATVDRPAVSSAVGPTHGCAYLLVIILAFGQDGASTRSRLLSVVPGIGGLLALRQCGLADGQLRPDHWQCGEGA